MTQRKSQYHEFRRMIALRAKQYFILMLHNRQYRGSMTFNHQTESLKLSVSLTPGGRLSRLVTSAARLRDCRYWTLSVFLFGRSSDVII